MFRFSARVISIGSKIFKKNDHIIYTSANIPSLRLTQSLAQTTTVDCVRKSIDVSTPQVVSLLNSLQELGFNEDEIKTVIQNNPDLINKSPALWNSVLGSLVYCGLPKSNILSMLEKWPSILSLKKSELDKNLQSWLGCRFGTELTYEILETHPYFLQVNNLIVEKRIKQYQLYFESKKRVGKLLLLAPNTLEENWDELLDKLNYLDELCTEKSDIVSTGVLAHTALHIKARHEFLIRAGIYKRPTKEFHKKLSKNPKLTNIVNLSDEEFVRKVAGLSLFEYEVFYEMFEKECEVIKNHHLDSEDEEEELKKISYSKHLKKSRK